MRARASSFVYTELVPLNCGKLATKYPWICGYFYSVLQRRRRWVYYEWLNAGNSLEYSGCTSKRRPLNSQLHYLCLQRMKWRPTNQSRGLTDHSGVKKRRLTCVFNLGHTWLKCSLNYPFEAIVDSRLRPRCATDDGCGGSANQLYRNLGKIHRKSHTSNANLEVINSKSAIVFAVFRTMR